MPAQNPAGYGIERRKIRRFTKKEPLEIPMNSEGFQLVHLAKYPREDLNLHGK